jgi:alkanesulfonate monooxygenase SsuD/methylene tetrahydromethanopterin reductase-like flavin-dependent oxidoreductase (luciferase family)
MSDVPWLGVHIKSDGAISAQAAIDLAVAAEAFGFSGVTLNEDVGHDVFGLLGAMAMSTSKIAIGSAIANVYTRSAFQLAMGAATVDDLSQGRAMLGLSVGHHPWNDQYHGIALEPPLPRLREYVTFIKQALGGEEFSFEGKIFHDVRAKLGFPIFRQNLPVFIGGDRPGMLALSAEIADGSIMNVVPAGYIADFAAEHYFSTARRAHRDINQLQLTAIVTCCVQEDRDIALRDARKTFIGRLRSNPKKVIELRSKEIRGELEMISQLIKGGEIERAAEEISEEIVTDTIAAGTPSEVMETLGRFYAAGCTRVVAAIFPRTPESIALALSQLAPIG